MNRVRPGPPARRARLTRQMILEAALEILSAEGLARLTMRRLAERLGVEAMSLYNYVDDKPDLLDGVASLVLSKIKPPDPGLPWAERLEAVMLNLYNALSAHPQLVTLLAAKQESPRDIAILAGMETIIGILEEAGLNPSQQVSAFRGMLALCFGLVLNHTMGLSTSLANAEAHWLDWDPRELARPDLPRLSRLAPYFLSTRPRDDLRFMLDAFLAAVGRAAR